MPQVADRGFLQSYEDVAGVGRDISLATTGVKIDGVAPTVADPPPEMGAHNDVVWADLGLSPDEIAQLKNDKVI